MRGIGHPCRLQVDDMNDVNSENKATRSKRHRDPHVGALCYGVQQAARVIDVSPREIYRLIAEKKLESIKIHSRRLIPRAALERLLAEAGR